MDNTKQVLFVVVLSLVLALGLGEIVTLSIVQSKENKAVVKELRYYQEATLLTDCLYREGTPVSTKTIKETLEAIDKIVKVYFPNGPYTREDFIAMAWLESRFNQFEIGTHQEKGIFQIMPDEFTGNDVTLNKYNIDTNTEMCMRVLKGKWTRFPDYKKGIIAYNGVIRNKKGYWNEKYWKAFEKRRSLVGELLHS